MQLHRHGEIGDGAGARADVRFEPGPQLPDVDRLSGKAPLVTPRACVAYAAGGSERLMQRLEREMAPK